MVQFYVHGLDPQGGRGPSLFDGRDVADAKLDGINTDEARRNGVGLQ
jgi:hypothetical protein